MIEKVKLSNVLFLDIETVPQVSHVEKLSEEAQHLFYLKNRARFAHPDLEKADYETKLGKVFNDVGGIQAEFGKIICITVGFVNEKSTGKEIRIKSFYHDDEETLLLQFKRLIDDNYSTPYHILCGHNAKEFDFPYICRRMLIHGIKLPEPLNIAGKKPWEIDHLDTMELWKFGDYKAYTSLALLCHVFNIPTPKDDISGADVAQVYYENEKAGYASGLERIKAYCEKDVVALIQLFLKLRGDALVEEKAIHYA